MENNALIEFRDVIKRFGDRTILDGVNLRIYEGDVTTIIGKSGTGKSVLLKHIIGLLKPDEGTILFHGMPIEKIQYLGGACYFCPFASSSRHNQGEPTTA